MAKYYSKPYAVEAVQWRGDNLREVIDLIGLHESVKDWPWDKYEDLVKREGLKVFFDGSGVMITVGDYIEKVVGIPFAFPFCIRCKEDFESYFVTHIDDGEEGDDVQV